MEMSNRKIKFLSLAIIIAHLAISTIHGLAHQGAMVALTPFGNVYVVVVITLAPLVAGGLLFSRLKRMGALLLATSMLGSLAFGGWYHFLSATNDNVREVHGPWRSTFLWTAIVLAVSELVGIMIGVWAVRAIQDTEE